MSPLILWVMSETWQALDMSLPETTSDRRPRRLKPTEVSLVVLVVVYLILALTFSLRTRAFEADDEQAHVQYVEYIVRHDAIPHISRANLQESHQPPLTTSSLPDGRNSSGFPPLHPLSSRSTTRTLSFQTD
jgi:hypothetical protein